MNTRWHLRQLRRRETPGSSPRRQRSSGNPVRPSPCLHLGDTARADDGATASRRRPEGSVFGLTEGQLDSLPEAIGVRQNSGVQLDSLIIAFGNDYLTLQDIASIGLIRDNLRKRPVYFSWSDGTYGSDSRAQRVLADDGARPEADARPIKEGSGIVFSNSLGFVDVPTTRKLLWETYRWQTAAAPARAAGWMRRRRRSCRST
jgi:hypothetical protein